MNTQNLIDRFTAIGKMANVINKNILVNNILQKLPKGYLEARTSEFRKFTVEEEFYQFLVEALVNTYGNDVTKNYILNLESQLN